MVRYVDLMESSIAQSIHKGFEKEKWEIKGLVYSFLIGLSPTDIIINHVGIWGHSDSASGLIKPPFSFNVGSDW